MPFVTGSASGLERCDGGCLVCIGFDEHVKSAEGEGGVGFLGEVEQFDVRRFISPHADPFFVFGFT